MSETKVILERIFKSKNLYCSPEVVDVINSRSSSSSLGLSRLKEYGRKRPYTDSVFVDLSILNTQ
jgi:hypothetical protein